MGFFEMFGFLATMSLLPAICFAVGFILVILEMFFPGFGVPGIAGSILLFLGIMFLANDLVEAAILLLIVLAFLGGALTFILHSASKGKLSKSMVLNDSLNSKSGYNSTENSEKYLNKIGIATSVLRPSGTADFDGVKLDVVTQGDFISEDSKVIVVKVEGRRIVVKELIK